ncbi:aldehyde ferredoxin oxidoreductase family protein [Archaeoglobus profundus]|uniref:Aldehyde ferredoxin oxidoreductase n=1 Tax=Archaeoglobus profundus (strain DSM 5631 / JCM 9629 / NBRC 100127 / Av18) TaxID=572546 RepID=D2RFT1_ARCPA|nr:aldehyde ferredoxin oxidoreductase family protein [Archaeoglobus profundus]ADB57156.1 Aldehyde ferredoxin oxidoreductase [Archaeoglobus profundus DSM 5631]
MRILKINLSEYSYEIEERDDFEEWIGGTALAVKLLKEEIDPKADPLSEDNIIVFAIGPFTPAYPLASKTVAMFKSPLTGNLGESHAGGRTAMAIANAGYRAIVIKGRSHKPIYVVVDNDKVYFRDARVIWGIADSLVVGRIIAERERGRGMRTVMRIGGAGVKLVRYACVTTETYRHFGRLGLGAVFGSKNLRALVVIGRGAFKVKDMKMYKEVYKEIFDLALKSDAMKKYHLIGTPVNVKPLNEIRALPTRNLTATKFEKADEISGEAFAEYNLGRRIACAHCPIACVHIATLRLPYENEPYFYRTIMISYDYELIYSLGSMLGVGSREGVLRLIHKVESLGLDAMSTGVCLAWATEALQKGLISENETLVKLEFGNVENYLQAIEYLYQQPNDFYRVLAEGVERASDVYGGKEFALAFGGNEMPGYHAGYATHIGYLIGLRHSHLDNAGYALDQKSHEYPSPEELVDKLVMEECWRQVLSSLVVCFFARGVYKPEIVSKAFKPLGYEISEDELEKYGEDTYREKLKIKVEMGFKKPRIPERIFETECTHGKLERDYIEKALDYWWKKYVS